MVRDFEQLLASPEATTVTLKYFYGVPPFEQKEHDARINNPMIGIVPWSFLFVDAAFASATVHVGPSVDDFANYFKATNFNFAIPDTAEIKKVTVSIKANASGGMGIGVLRFVQLLDEADNLVGDVQEDSVLMGDFMTKTFVGITDDLWGTSLTPAVVNHPNFGVAISAGVMGFPMPSDETDVNIQNVYIRIDYDSPLTNEIFDREEHLANVTPKEAHFRCIHDVPSVEKLDKYPGGFIKEGESVFYFSTKANLREPIHGFPVIWESLTIIDSQDQAWKPKLIDGAVAAFHHKFRVGQHQIAQAVACRPDK